MPGAAARSVYLIYRFQVDKPGKYCSFLGKQLTHPRCVQKKKKRWHCVVSNFYGETKENLCQRCRRTKRIPKKWMNYEPWECLILRLKFRSTEVCQTKCSWVDKPSNFIDFGPNFGVFITVSSLANPEKPHMWKNGLALSAHSHRDPGSTPGCVTCDTIRRLS